MTGITIPSSVTAIDMEAFYGCIALESVKILATTPPTLGFNAFNNPHADLKIHVPADSLAQYKGNESWSGFEVTANNTTAVTGVTLTSPTLELTVGAGGPVTLTSTVAPEGATNKDVTFTSSNTGVAMASIRRRRYRRIGG